MNVRDKGKVKGFGEAAVPHLLKPGIPVPTGARLG